MRKTSFMVVSCLALAARASFAQAQPPALAPPVPADAPLPAAATAIPPGAAAPTPTEPASPAPQAAEAVPAPAVPAPEETFPAAWFRIDSDLGSVQLWAGATHMLSDRVGIASDLYVLNTVGAGGLLSLGELDVGLSFVAGSLYITPMIGLQVDWVNHRAAALVPQLYVTGGPDPIYMELWLQNYAYSVFDKDGTSPTGGGNYVYGRLFLDYKLGKYLAVGPEAEITYALNDKSNNAVSGDKLASLPVGVNVMLPNYGKGNNVFIFAGYETMDTANDAHFAGRLTFVRNF